MRPRPRIYLVAFIFLLGVICLSAQSGCSSSSSQLLPSGAAPTYIGPGSEWNLFLNATASLFELVHMPSVGATGDYTGIGPYQSYATGFMTMHVREENSGTDGPAPGLDSYALQIPAVAFFMAPFGTAGSIQGMLPPNVCPTANISGNFIKLRQPAGWTAGAGGGDTFGTINYNLSNAVSSTVNDFNLDTVASNDSAADQGARSLTLPSGCSGGTVRDGTTESFLSLDTFYIHRLTPDDLYFAIPAPSTPVAATSLAGNYAGIVYQAASGGSNHALTLTLAVSGSNVTGTATVVSDVTTGASAGLTNPVITLGSVTLAAPSVTGFVAGTISFGAGNDPLVCLPQLNAGGTTQTLIVCAGTDDSGGYYSLVLVSH